MKIFDGRCDNGEGAPLVNRLQGLATELAAAGNLTEQAFLVVGEQVGTGRRRCRQLLSQAQVALHPVEGESVEDAVNRLQLLTERGALWLTGARRQSRSICETLRSLEMELGTLLNPMQGLGKVAKTLQALRVATRIEAARYQGHGAWVLGQELQHLGTSLYDKLEKITGRFEVLVTLLRRAMAQEEMAQAGPLREADAEVQRTRALLAGVASRCVLTTDHAEKLRCSTTELAERFGELVAALQFQDITRQRLQHIERALLELSGRVAVDAGAADTHAIGRICELQHDQLHLAVCEFDEAVDRLADNLRGMVHGAQSLADSTCTMLSSDSRERYDGIAPSLHAVTECLERVQTTNLAAGQAVFAVCQAVRDVDQLTVEIELLGEEMQLLAQNAAVSAAHGSGRSAGLSVIAANIQGLAEEAGRLAVAMAERCRSVSRQSEELDARDQESDHGDVRLDELLAEARPWLERMEDGGRLLDEGMATIGREVAEIAAGVEQALSGLDIRRRFRACVDPVLGQLARLAQAQDDALFAGQHRDILDSMRSRYTMKSERDIHQNFLQKFDEEVDVPEDSAAPGSTLHPLGSNVELF